MSILIKGMEMPKNCTECKIKGEGSDSLYTWSCPFTGLEYTRYDCVNDRLDDCPLVEVSVPHKDLVDRETLMQEVEKYIIKPDMITNNMWNECVKTIMYEIKNANAIIEEEDE